MPYCNFKDDMCTWQVGHRRFFTQNIFERGRKERDLLRHFNDQNLENYSINENLFITNVLSS